MVKIIIFQNLEEHEYDVYCSTDALVMEFYRGYDIIDPDEKIIIDGAEWQYEPTYLLPRHSNFEKIWSYGMEFQNNPERVMREREKEVLKNEIEIREKELEDLKNKLKEII
jgi:hypothetical protein